MSNNLKPNIEEIERYLFFTSVVNRQEVVESWCVLIISFIDGEREEKIVVEIQV